MNKNVSDKFLRLSEYDIEYISSHFFVFNDF